jgi:starch phosphorylase
MEIGAPRSTSFMKHPKYAHSFEVVSELPNALAGLARLAYNFRWTWHHECRDLFKEMDKNLWSEVEHNPVALLNKIPKDRLERLAKDKSFLAQLESCESDLDQYLTDETWFDRTYPGQRESTLIAYFCAEFGVSESLPIYSGGLGVLAGDHLKAASDLGIPLVGVGLLYSRGYFRQRLSHDGWQQENYPPTDFFQMPLHLERGPDQQPLRVEIELPDRTIVCQIWRAEVGRIPLYLLDSNVLENAPNDQQITDTLYGGDQEMRIRQEMILGIGGIRLLKALDLRPTVCHMNEGHAAFLSIERIRQFMEEKQVDYRTARKVIVSGNVFTTHTPVPAGFDLFPPELLEQYASRAASSVGLTLEEFTRLGRIDPENEGEPFNMALLAMKNSNAVNGVSKLHAKVTREMFSARWPDFPEEEAPIDSVTNGIHTPTWVSKRMTELFDAYLGAEWRRDSGNPQVWEGVARIPDSELWEVIENQRGDLVRTVRRRIHKELERRGFARSEFGAVESILDPRVLTVGFARRFATYKRAALLLSDKERLKRILFHPERPVQFVLAGKSHPRDDGGKKLIQELIHFIQHEGGRARMVFLEDYDMGVARSLVQGVDVWLNNPRRPMEASGTSGMKVVPNGGLNFSVLDGWWDEAYDPGVGWAIGERYEYADPEQQDWADSRALYHVLETEIAPRFYSSIEGSAPKSWIGMVKHSISKLAPMFSTSRMVREYAERFYMPTNEFYHRLTSDGLQRARAAIEWRDRIQSLWHDVRILGVNDHAGLVNTVGTQFEVRAQVRLGSISPEEVRVEALVGQIGPSRELSELERFRLQPEGGDSECFSFVGSIPCDVTGHRGYTIRVLPEHPDLNVPGELNLATWEE